MAPDDAGVGWITCSWVELWFMWSGWTVMSTSPLVLWFEVSIFPLLLRLAAVWGCIMLSAVVM